MLRYSYTYALRTLTLLLLIALSVTGCPSRQRGNGEDLEKYRDGKPDVMMPVPYTPRDDGQPLTAAELHAFKTVGVLDKKLSAEEAQIVELHFKSYVHQNRATFQRFLDRSARFLPHIKKIFKARGIPEEVAYLCMVESGGNPNARSRVGAMGLWQFMPYTGKRFALKQTNWIDERRDPYKATYAASDYLLKLYSDFGNWHLAIAAYNAGEGKIGRAVSGTGAKDFFELCRLDCQLEYSQQLRTETREYVPRLLAMTKIMRNLKALGFKEPAASVAWDLKPMTVPPGTNLSGLARHLGLTWDEFSGMNPAYRRTASPPNAESTAYVPPSKLASAQRYVASAEARSFAGWNEYAVRKGDSLASIARKHGTSVAALRQANGFSKLPRRGTTILIPAGSKPEPIYEARPKTERSPSASAGVYKVTTGDTLFNLAKRWGTDVASIRIANRMGSKEDSLKPGQRINIPGNAKSPGVNRGAQSGSPAQQYTVKKGDTVGTIAQRHGVSLAALRSANGLTAKSSIRVGQKLSIPGSGKASKNMVESARPTGSSYIVKSGDTLYSVARAAGISADSLATANKINKSNPRLRVGQKLVLPSAVKGKAAPAKDAAGKTKAKKTGKTRTVTVQSGQTLFGIAKSNNVSVQALQKANGLSGTSLKVGQKLTIPAN